MPPSTLALSFLFVASSFAQYQQFVTRPYDKAVNITILENNDPDALAPGLFFLTPYIQGGQYLGPQIFTTDGTLVWYGNNTATEQADDAHVCNYLGTTTICYNDGETVEQGGHSTGYNQFLNHQYQPAGPAISGSGGLRGPDTHETNTPDGNGDILLQDVFQPRKWDLSAYAGPTDGWIMDCCFQEINLVTGGLNFQWCASDYVSLNESYVLMWNSPYIPGNNHEITHTNEIAGNGSETDPWDFFHMNSIDRDTNGDYLVSGRHVSSVYKISGKKATYGPPGQILWTLGGKQNDFSMNYNFSCQHMARFLSSTGTSAQLSIFDDASDGTYFASSSSSGIVVSLDTTTNTSTLNHRYVSPIGEITVSQGSVQVLPNNNAVVGWGSLPYYSEFAQDGTLLYHALFGGLPFNFAYAFQPNIMSYRAYQTEWLAAPSAPPDLVVYAETCANATVFAYASWNGATSVARWRFRGGASDDQSTWTELANVGKRGFESGAVVKKAASGVSAVMYVVVDALNTDGRVLGSSVAVRTFVPLANTAGCGVAACANGTDYTLAANQTATCPH